MEDTFEPEGFWITLYAIVLIPFLFWLYYPSRPLQDVSVAEHDNLPTFPPAPPRRPTPKYITLADLAKKSRCSASELAQWPSALRWLV